MFAAWHIEACLISEQLAHVKALHRSRLQVEVRSCPVGDAALYRLAGFVAPRFAGFEQLGSPVNPESDSVEVL